MRAIQHDSTNQSVVIRIVDSTDGTPETGVEHNTSGIDLWYRREGAAKASITEAALSALTDAHSDGGIEHIGDGYYRLDIPDAAFASGVSGVLIGGGVTDMVVIGCYVPLVAYDPSQADLGLNNLSTSDIDNRLAAIHLDHLLAADYDPDSKPGTATALLNELVESDGGVSRFTANALEEAPSGGGTTNLSTEGETIVSSGS